MTDEQIDDVIDTLLVDIDDPDPVKQQNIGTTTSSILVQVLRCCVPPMPLVGIPSRMQSAHQEAISCLKEQFRKNPLMRRRRLPSCAKWAKH
jgi:hypothetical protein